MLSENNEEIQCVLRGKFKLDYKHKQDKMITTDIAVAGDRVIFDLLDDGTGVINEVLDRDNYLSRKAPRLRGAGRRGQRLEQVLAANIDKFFIITSVIQPAFNPKALDRFLVAGESSHLNNIIVVNKVDTDPDNLIDDWVELYRDIGYTVIKSSAETGEGIDEIRALLKNSKSIFWGHSAVGKSSIINKLYPGLDIKVGDVSEYWQKGKHTTVAVTMHRVEEDTFIIDTPGIREIDPYGIRKEDLGHYFVDFVPFINECKYNTCVHLHEPGCAIIEAVENGEIYPERYDSYLNILETIEEDIIF